MSPTARSDEIALIESAFEALARGDLAVLEEALAPDARWLAVEQMGPWSCDGRGQIIDRIRAGLGAAPGGRIEQMIQQGEHVLVAFRPQRPPGGGRPLEDGLAWIVLTFRRGSIVELKGCADRAHALAYADGQPRPEGG
jgi:ketosteroid isomerase-like protein